MAMIEIGHLFLILARRNVNIYKSQTKTQKGAVSVIYHKHMVSIFMFTVQGVRHTSTWRHLHKKEVHLLSNNRRMKREDFQSIWCRWWIHLDDCMLGVVRWPHWIRQRRTESAAVSNRRGSTNGRISRPERPSWKVRTLGSSLMMKIGEWLNSTTVYGTIKWTACCNTTCQTFPWYDTETNKSVNRTRTTLSLETI